MAVIKLEALRALVRAIEAAVPTLTMHTYAGQAPPSKAICLPSLAIMVSGAGYEANQETVAFSETGSSICVFNVGMHKLNVQLRLACATLGERYEIENKIINAFLATELHPGVLLTTVTACEDLGDFLAAWELEGSEWRDEKAFDNQYWSVTEVLGQVPALVTRTGVYTIDELKLGLTEDFSAFTSETFDTSSNVEVVEINEDGSITPA